VSFNLFNEAKPFAVILIATEPISFLGGLLRPEGPKFEAKGREWERGSWRGAVSPPHQLRVWGSAVSSTSGVQGRATTY